MLFVPNVVYRDKISAQVVRDLLHQSKSWASARLKRYEV
jgi:hypothetical protein